MHKKWRRGHPCHELEIRMAQKQGHGPDDFRKILPVHTSGHMLMSWRACLSPCPQAQPGSQESWPSPAALVQTAVWSWDGILGAQWVRVPMRHALLPVQHRWGWPERRITEPCNYQSTRPTEVFRWPKQGRGLVFLSSWYILYFVRHRHSNEGSDSWTIMIAAIYCVFTQYQRFSAQDIIESFQQFNQGADISDEKN